MVTLEKIVDYYEFLYKDITKHEEKGITSIRYRLSVKRAFNSAEYLLGTLVLTNFGVDKENRRHLRNKEPWRIKKYIEEEFKKNPAGYTTEFIYLPNLRKNLIKKMKDNKIIPDFF